VPLTPPQGDEIVVAIEAAPINPSDLGLLLGPADPAAITAEDGPVAVAPLSDRQMAIVKGRAGESMPVGVEGAGKVVAAGPDAQQLLGQTVALFAGSTYATHRKVRAHEVLPLGDANPRDGAAAFVNPLTALSMVETMRIEGHKAIIHTAGASNLGQMLARICRDDGVPLIAVVRSEAQAQILRDIGGVAHICDSSRDDFAQTLTRACAETGAPLAFDAVGGPLTGTLLNCMERALSEGQPYTRYGSSVHKQVYVYGLLDTSPITLPRAMGMAWSVGGYLLPQFLAKAPPEVGARMRKRVADELTTTFASHYSDTITLQQALDPDTIRDYARMATGKKYLITPQG